MNRLLLPGSYVSATHQPACLPGPQDFVGRKLERAIVHEAQAAVDGLLALARRLNEYVVEVAEPENGRFRLVHYWTGPSADAAIQARLIAALVNGNLWANCLPWEPVLVPSCDSLYR